MVTYTKAKEDYRFVLTNLGFENCRVAAKFDDNYVHKDTYNYTVPTAWITKGYVQEVKING